MGVSRGLDSTGAEPVTSLVLPVLDRYRFERFVTDPAGGALSLRCVHDHGSGLRPGSLGQPIAAELASSRRSRVAPAYGLRPIGYQGRSAHLVASVPWPDCDSIDRRTKRGACYLEGGAPRSLARERSVSARI